MFDDTTLENRRQERLKKEALENIKNMTIAERLMRRANQLTTSIIFSDDYGNFEIIMRQPTRKELDELLQFQKDIQKQEKQEEASNSLYFILGNLCTDKSLNYDFWKDGNYNLVDLMEMITKLFNNTAEKFKEVQNFRQK